jgi:epoxyqueuosine reductase
VKAALVQRARELGFDDCRVAEAGPARHREQYRRWLAEGRHGTMAYLERTADKRLDPRLLLEGARSVVMLAISYGGGPAVEEGVRERGGIVARYARHDDYHDVIAGRLAMLASAVEAWGGPGTRCLAHIDAGPVLERDFAEQAGLGFVGKHTNLIGRRLGNWFFLASLVTTAEIEPDESESNHCGSCTRCLAACPTGAITEPFRLDARRCISYLTIELKGSIPEELRPAVGRRIFGCDDCLAVCPWNRFAREGRMLAEHRRVELGALDLVDLLSLDDAGFKRRFAGTPLLRPKRRGFLRNVCVALGNLGDARALPALEKASLDPEPLVAEHARWAIARIESGLSRGG